MRSVRSASSSSRRPIARGCVNLGLKRLGVDAHDRQYYALHSTLDIAHSKAWNNEVIGPLVREDAARAVAIAEGALMRLRAGERCFERYRRSLGVAGVTTEHAVTSSATAASWQRRRVCEITRSSEECRYQVAWSINPHMAIGAVDFYARGGAARGLRRCAASSPVRTSSGCRSCMARTTRCSSRIRRCCSSDAA